MWLICAIVSRAVAVIESSASGAAKASGSNPDGRSYATLSCVAVPTLHTRETTNKTATGTPISNTADFNLIVYSFQQSHLDKTFYLLTLSQTNDIRYK